MYLKLIDYLRGYLLVELQGTNIERLLNMYCFNKITCFCIQSQEYTRCNIYYKDFHKSRLLAKKCNISYKIIKRIGLRFIFKKQIHNFGKTIGCLLFVLSIYILSLFVWKIEISGNSKNTTVEILNEIDNINIHPAIALSSIDYKHVEDIIRQKYSDISWVSVSHKGCSLIINIEEAYIPESLESVETDVPAHIVAKENCIITSIITRKGKPVAKEGSMVKKGSVIISGIIEIYDDYETSFVKYATRASGDIDCKVYRYINTSILRYNKNEIYTGRYKKGLNISILNQNIFEYCSQNNYDIYDEANYNYNPSFFTNIGFPIGINIYTRFEVNSYDDYMDEKESYIMGQKTFAEWLLNETGDNKLISADCDYIINDDTIELHGYAVIIAKDAWEYVDILPEELNTDNDSLTNGGM